MFNRPTERQELRFHADAGRSILMLAPRRIGKTWLIGRFADDLRAAGWTAVLCDVQDIATEIAFLRHLCLSIEQQADVLTKAKGRASQALAQLFANDKSGGWKKALADTDWKSFAETLVQGLDERGVPTMILIDELALFVARLQKRNAGAAHDLLYGLRALQQKYKNVRWLFTGSIGLDTVARRSQLGGALVDLQHVPLEPFSPAAARAYIAHLCCTKQVRQPFSLADDAFAAFHEALGWLSPHYIAQLCLLIRPSGAANTDARPAATSDDVAAAFQRILGREYRNQFVTWEEHLSKNFKTAEANALRQVLSVCARASAGEQADTILARLGTGPTLAKRKTLRDQLHILVGDGYLDEIDDRDIPRYRFRSGLLRRYWLRYVAE